MEETVKPQEVNGLELSSTELSVLMEALNRKNDGSPRTFVPLKLHDIASISKKIKEVFESYGTQDSETKAYSLTAGDTLYPIDLKTSEKSIILECINQREWTSFAAEAVLSLTEKLE